MRSTTNRTRGAGQSQLIERGRQIAEELGAHGAGRSQSDAHGAAMPRGNQSRSRRHQDLPRPSCCVARRPIDRSDDAGSSKPDRGSDDVLTLAVPARLKRVGREMRMLVENADDQAAADPSLLRIIARAHDIQARLSQNPKLTVHDVAREEQVSAAYLYTLLRLPWLAPDITTAIINGEQPPQLNAKTLMRLAPRLPADWAEQRKLLGFAEEQIAGLRLGGKMPRQHFWRGQHHACDGSALDRHLQIFGCSECDLLACFYLREPSPILPSS